MHMPPYIHPAPPKRPEDTSELRDYFAAKAMQAYLAHEVAANSPEDVVAQWAYTMADAMLRARGQA